MWANGSILGVVEIVDCVRNFRSKWADKGAWHWVLKNPRKLPASLFVRGRLGLWELPDDVAQRIVKLTKLK